MSPFHPVTLLCRCSHWHNHHNIHRNTSLAVFKQSEQDHASETDRIHIHTQRYNYRGVLRYSWKDASSNCVVCTSNEFGPCACSQRGRECVYVCVYVCWGKGVLLGVAPVLVYIETDRYLDVEILKTVGEVLMMWWIRGVAEYHLASGHERSVARGLFSLPIMPVPEVHLS